jgi:hypothetical protein
MQSYRCYEDMVLVCLVALAVVVAVLDACQATGTHCATAEGHTSALAVLLNGRA